MAKYAGREFKSEWDFNPLRYRFRIAAADGLSAAVMGAAVAAGPLFLGLPIGVVAGIALASAALQYATLHNDKNIGHVVTANTIEAGDRYQAIANDIFRKAGIDPSTVQCRTKDTPGGTDGEGGGPLTPSFYNNAVVFPKTLTRRDQDILMIGGCVLAELNDGELKAIIAHETSHILNPQRLRSQYVMGGLAYGCGLLAVISCVMGNVPALLCYGAAFAAQQVLGGFSKRQDEWRADYNSLGLHPHPNDLRSALDKMTALQGQGHAGTAKDSGEPTLRDRAIRFFMPHPGLESRKAHSRRLFPAVQSFYGRNGMRLDA